MQVKTKLFIFGVILLGIISFVGKSTFNKIQYKKKVKEDISILDSIQYLSIDGSIKQIAPSANHKIIFFFSTECGHCESEVQLVFSNATRFENAEIYFLSMEDTADLTTFVDQYQLSLNSGIEMGQIDKNVIHSMGVNTYPMCFIYASDGTLLKKYAGVVKIEAIVQYLQ